MLDGIPHGWTAPSLKVPPRSPSVRDWNVESMDAHPANALESPGRLEALRLEDPRHGPEVLPRLHDAGDLRVFLRSTPQDDRAHHRQVSAAHHNPNPSRRV